MKKILTILAIGIFASCTKPEPMAITTPCVIGGLKGTYYKFAFTNNDVRFFDSVVLDTMGVDSFSMDFPALLSTGNVYPLWRSEPKMCSKMEYWNPHISLSNHKMYVFMKGDTLVDSIVENGYHITSLYFRENRY